MPINEGTAKLAGKEQERLGIPSDLKFYSAMPFGSMNQEDARHLIDDPEFYWIENFIQTGKGKLRTIPDVAPPLYAAPAGESIVYFYWFAINTADYCAVFLSDGTAVQVDTAGNVTPITTQAQTFYQGGQLPVCSQSGSQYLLIANNTSVNAYWIWDGTVLYAPGTVGPFQIGDLTASGSGYVSPPTVIFIGGSGGSVAGTATIENGEVVDVTITNPGIDYAPSDGQLQIIFTGGGTDNGAQLIAGLAAAPVSAVNVSNGGTGYTSAPSVTFTGGGGTGAAATATVVNGIVTKVTLTNPGSGYSQPPIVGFTGGGGHGATAVATLAPSAVAGVQIIDGGTGYTGTPTITFQGGGGSGAQGTVTVTNGVITAVNMTQGGKDYTSPPLVIVQPGNNRAAQGLISLMPFGVSGTSIEQFQSRIWISNPNTPGPLYNGGVFNVSAPSSLTDFSTADGGLLYTSTDRFLKKQYIALHQSNGYLYPFGDSSVDVISNVQTAGTPPTTTFNYQNTSATVGAGWRDAVQDYGQSVLFANQNGVFGLYGGSVPNISRKINTIFANAVWPPAAGAVTPSAAVANIYTFPVYFLLATITDPTTNKPRTVMIGWNEKTWMIATQSRTPSFIGTKTTNSVMTAWGTDGATLFQMFAQPSASLQKKLMTKMFAGDIPYIVKQPMAMWLRAADLSAAQSGVALNVTLEGYGIAQQAGQHTDVISTSAPNVLQPNFSAPQTTAPVYGMVASSVPGTALGVTITTTSIDILIQDISVAYRYEAPIYG